VNISVSDFDIGRNATGLLGFTGDVICGRRYKYLCWIQAQCLKVEKFGVVQCVWCGFWCVDLSATAFRGFGWLRVGVWLALFLCCYNNNLYF
jgi:hypothetical protein